MACIVLVDASRNPDCRQKTIFRKRLSGSRPQTLAKRKARGKLEAVEMRINNDVIMLMYFFQYITSLF
jgi:hypothetical protein